MSWIPVADKLPDLDVDVLIATKCDNIFIMKRVDLDGQIYWTDFERPFLEPDDVTHWMTLPAKP